MDAETIVRDWQRPFYNLAYRMLGNEADAADATQEIFIQIFRDMNGLDPSREFRPWAYRVATNVTLKIIRNRKLRNLRENEAAMEREGYVDPNSAKFHAEKRETEKLFLEKLSGLPEEERSLLVLHYYQELPTTEIASALELPRSTVQSRLEKALGSLRKSLAGAGLFAAVPEIELMMRSSASLPVPAKLAGSLATLASQAGTMTTGLTIGGILMTKQLVLTSVLIGALSLGIGLWAGKSFLGKEEVQGKPPAGELVSKSELDALRALQQQTAARATSLEEENRKLLASSTSERRAVAALPAPEGVDLEKVTVAAGSASAAKKTIDWSHFADLLDKNVDALLAQFEAEEQDGGAEPSKEQQAKLQELMVEFMKLTAQAKEISENPIFDAEIAKGFTGALYEKTLQLSPSQAASLRTAVEASLAQAQKNLEGKETLPTQMFLARTELLDGIVSHLDASLEGAQKERWSKLDTFTNQMLAGDSSVSQIGVQGQDGDVSQQVMSRWKTAFSLTPDQEPGVRAVASDFTREGQAILAKYGQTGSDSSMGIVERRAMNREFLLAQIRMEKRFAHLLTPEQRRTMSGRTPTVLRFAPVNYMSTNVRRGPGF